MLKRYKEFAGNDPTRKYKFYWGSIYNNIESNFGMKYELVPLNRANELMEYLQKRIDRTRQACINKGKGYKSYSTFEDFVKQHFKE